MENQTIIEVNNISKSFDGTDAVKNVTFSVPDQTIFGFIGPSGSGKTTTIRILTGYYKPTAGKVFVFGIQPDAFSRQERENIGYLPQLFGLYPNLTVWENLNFAASIYGMPLRRKKRLEEVMAFVELENDRGQIARQLSGGMMRRLNLAATLVHSPDLIFLDEPTAGIDPILRRKFWDHFRELRNNGRTLFVTTQYVSEAAYCDLLGVIDRGSLVAVGTPAELRYRAFGGDLIDMRMVNPIRLETFHFIKELPFVRKEPLRRDDYNLRIVVDEANTDIAKLLDWGRETGVEIDTIEEYKPPFDDVFVELVKAQGDDEAIILSS